jgi:hypothetical protein
MDPELEAQAEVVVSLIRSQNWKSGGCLTVDDDDAVAAVTQLMRAAFSAGMLAGIERAGKNIVAALDAVSR